MNLLFLLGFGPSVADDIESVRSPTQCDAVFIAPAEANCQIEGSWATTASARSGAKAKELALNKLQEVIHLEIQVRLNQASPDAQDLIRPLLVGCSSAAMANAEVYCSSEPRLAEKEYCYASFSDSSCWKGVGLEITGKATWKAMEEGRTEVCAAMETWMVERNIDQVKRDSCQLACMQSAKVSCRDF
jgi:hypothetical protein